MKRIAHTLTLALAALVLTACATATLTRLAYANAALAYSNLGPMITWMVDDYVDLSGVQEDWVRERVARLMDWHRSEELPRYGRFLQSTLAKLEGPVTPADAADHQRALRSHWQRLVIQALPDVAEFLSGIEGEQVSQLERKFAEDNRKFARESTRGSPEERRERRMRRFADQLEVWIGPLSDQQRTLVAEHYRGLPDFTEEMLGERRFRQGEIIAMLRARTPKDEMVPKLRRLLVDVDSWRRPEYSERVRARDARAHEMVATLSTTLSTAQRAALQNRIRGFMRDIATLTAANPRPAS